MIQTGTRFNRQPKQDGTLVEIHDNGGGSGPLLVMLPGGRAARAYNYGEA